MKKKIDILLTTLFGFFISIALLIGAVVAFMYMIGFVIGGGTATQLALSGKSYLDFAIKLSTIGVTFGLLKFYITGSHALTLNNEDNTAA